MSTAFEGARGMACFSSSWLLHKNNPVGFVVLAGALDDDWLYVCQRQNLANGAVVLLVEPEHARPAAHVQNCRGVTHERLLQSLRE